MSGASLHKRYKHIDKLRSIEIHRETYLRMLKVHNLHTVVHKTMCIRNAVCT